MYQLCQIPALMNFNGKWYEDSIIWLIQQSFLSRNNLLLDVACAKWLLLTWRYCLYEPHNS